VIVSHTCVSDVKRIIEREYRPLFSTGTFAHTIFWRTGNHVHTDTSEHIHERTQPHAQINAEVCRPPRFPLPHTHFDRVLNFAPLQTHRVNIEAHAVTTLRGYGHSCADRAHAATVQLSGNTMQEGRTTCPLSTWMMQTRSPLRPSSRYRTNFLHDARRSEGR